MRSGRLGSGVFLVLLLSGCVTNAEHFYKFNASLSLDELCDSYRQSQRDGDEKLSSDIRNALAQRFGKSSSDCAAASNSSGFLSSFVEGFNEGFSSATERGQRPLSLVERCQLLTRNLTGMVGLQALNACISGGLAANQRPEASSDNDFAWDWDQFYDANNRLVWRCRGIQSGRFAEDSRCSGKRQTDTRWAGKSAKTR